jgi:hypothetical protein
MPLTVAPASGEFCTVDPVPAATLLLPYFEVDLSRRGNVTTLFSIVNLDPAPALAHVVLWTDWAIPTFAFDVYLTGFDVETIDLRELFLEGELPGSAGDFDGCVASDPDDDELERLRRAHTGRETGAGCQAHDHDDGRARGYVTIDSVSECSLLFPGQSNYFDNGAGVANSSNQLAGEYLLSERRGRGLAAGSLVAVEAAQSNGTAGYTFYGRYVEGTGIDHREPLGTVWATRYLDRVAFGKSRRSVDNEVVVWRDTTFSGLEQAYECGEESPPWYPLNETQVVAFNEQEDAVEICFPFEEEEGGDLVDPVCAPLATQRVRIGHGDLDLPFDEGWIYWNLNHVLGGTGAVSFDGLAQSYVTGLLNVSSLRGEVPAFLLATACEAADPLRP